MWEENFADCEQGEEVEGSKLGACHVKQEAPEGSRGVTSNSRAKPSLTGAGKTEALSERQRRWQWLFKPRKPLRIACLESRGVGKAAMGKRGQGDSYSNHFMESTSPSSLS